MEEIKRDIKCTNSHRGKCVAENLMECVLINTREQSGMSCWYLLLDGNSALRVELQLQPSVSVLNMSTCYHQRAWQGYNVSLITVIFQHTEIKCKIMFLCCCTNCPRSSLHTMKTASFPCLWLISAILGWLEQTMQQRHSLIYK